MSQRLAEVFKELKEDLIHEDGPRISTMRNYRFCIVVYPPDREYELRRHVQQLSSEMAATGWVVKSLSLQRILIDRLGARGDGYLQRLIEREKAASKHHHDRGLNFVRQKITPEIEGPEGIAADVSREICEFVDAHPERAERTVAIIGRAGALYPFFRMSALLKHLDGKTGNVPVVLLYPGEREGDTGLKFMGRMGADSDYRPRIYG